VGRIRRGFSLAGQSWRVLRSDRTLGAFPVLSLLVVLALAATLWLPAALLLERGSTPLGVVLAAVGLYVVTFAGVFFSVALAGAAATVLDGGDATVAGGISVARARLPQIAGWAAFAASVNLVISALEARFQGISTLLLRGLQVAWGLVTFLVVPVIAFEGLGPFAALRRSGGLFRQRFGEQLAGQVAIGGAVILIGVLPAAGLIALGAWAVSAGAGVLGGVLIGLGIVVVLVASVLGTCLSQIFGVALYRYAVDGTASAPFSEDDLRGAVTRRRGAPSQI
jgi:hypothetical protein